MGHVSEPSPVNPANRIAAEQRLWGAVQSTRTEYLAISEQLDCLVRDQNHFGSIDMGHPDGLQHTSNLAKQRTLAFERYKQALSAYRAALSGLPPPPNRSSLYDLTPRETEVLKLIANGMSSREIASELGIAFKTVVCH